jgi:hypothetical protein
MKLAIVERARLKWVQAEFNDSLPRELLGQCT